MFLLIIATTCLATSTVGLMCSSLVRRTSTAMVLTYLTLLVLFVLPMGLSWYLAGDERREQSFTPERLASFTVTSPFSAALSVPMHTSRIENWAGTSMQRGAVALGPADPAHRPARLDHLPGALPAAELPLPGHRLPGLPLALVEGKQCAVRRGPRSQVQQCHAGATIGRKRLLQSPSWFNFGARASLLFIRIRLVFSLRTRGPQSHCKAGSQKSGCSDAEGFGFPGSFVNRHTGHMWVGLMAPRDPRPDVR